MICTPPCYELILRACSATIVIKAGLTPSTSYYWLLTTRTGKIYQRQAATDGDGKLTIDCSLLPKGLLTPYAGFFTLEVRKGDDYLQKADLLIGGKTYPCVQLKFATIDAEPANLYNQIG